jgi:hypothetical protein
VYWVKEKYFDRLMAAGTWGTGCQSGSTLTSIWVSRDQSAKYRLYGPTQKRAAIGKSAEAGKPLFDSPAIKTAKESKFVASTYLGLLCGRHSP